MGIWTPVNRKDHRHLGEKHGLLSVGNHLPVSNASRDTLPNRGLEHAAAHARQPGDQRAAHGVVPAPSTAGADRAQSRGLLLADRCLWLAARGAESPSGARQHLPDRLQQVVASSGFTSQPVEPFFLASSRLACWLSVVSARMGVKRSSLRASLIMSMPSEAGWATPAPTGARALAE